MIDVLGRTYGANPTCCLRSAPIIYPIPAALSRGKLCLFPGFSAFFTEARETGSRRLQRESPGHLTGRSKRFCMGFAEKNRYRIPFSYGIPSAFGAREFLEVKARTIREMI